MKDDDIMQGDRGTLIRAALLRHNKKTDKHLTMMLPPFLKKNKLSFEEKQMGGEIARVRYIYIYIYACVCVCVCFPAHIFFH